MPTSATPRLARIQLHPIKSLDPIEVPEARIGPNGGLESDRAWALYTVDGRWVNAKRTAAMHRIRAAYPPDLKSVALSAPDDSRKMYVAKLAFPEDTERAADWFSAYFEQQIIVRYAREGFPDDGLAPGPTIISTASLQTVCEWFPGLSRDEARLRFRATLEIEGVPAFWEDQLFAESESSVVRFRIGHVAFEGSNPCARCPVPSRDARTGEIIPDFTRRFSDKRRATFPPWSHEIRFDHYYRLAVNTRVPSTEAGKLLRLGDFLSL
ncbi:MAG TPA: MOSC N-terminal beta barrel domain-containing protein [Candidatus Methylomirabilis sp.]|nr:MOSC N-terminal beta barrel domain-containing protein [Candidatus Methylomirabilis sp.]